MRGSINIICSITPWAFAIVVLPASVADDNEITIVDIKQVWQARTNRIDSFAIHWTASRLVGAETGSIEKAGETVWYPKEDVEGVRTSKFLMDGNDKIRFERDGAHMVSETGSLEDRRLLSVSDGDESKSYYDKEAGSDLDSTRFAPSGFIEREEIPFELKSIGVKPVLLPLRPFHRYVTNNYSLDDFSIVGPMVADGRPCLRLQKRTRRRRIVMFVDREREFLPVKVLNYSTIDETDGESDKEALTSMIEIKYARDDASDFWLPSSWKHGMFKRDGRVLHQASATVEHAEVNLDIPISEFRFEFPPGTMVSDRRNGDYYVLRKDGTRRNITNAETNPPLPYQTLLNTEPGEAVGASSSNWASTITAFLTINALVIAAAVVAFRAYRRFGRN